MSRFPGAEFPAAMMAVCLHTGLCARAALTAGGAFADPHGSAGPGFLLNHHWIMSTDGTCRVMPVSGRQSPIATKFRYARSSLALESPWP